MEYYSLNQYLKDTFGCKVYKIALDGGFSCPNRDGSLGTRGCIFCSGKGSGNFAEPVSLNEKGIPNVYAQIEAGKARVARKNPNGKYIAYFQSFTNTYGPLDYLKEVYTQAMEHPEIVALSIGTRPDCLPDDVITLLKELNEIKPVWVELGLQTIHRESAKYIRRGYELSVYDDGVRRLREAGIDVIVHCILGLPYETREMMKETVSYVGKSGVKGIKLQLLHVLKGTDLAREYEAGKFSAMEMEEYVSLVAECISLLPEDMVIHRITGDGDKRELIAPLWSADKKRVLNALQKVIKDIN